MQDGVGIILLQQKERAMRSQGLLGIALVTALAGPIGAYAQTQSGGPLRTTFIEAPFYARIRADSRNGLLAQRCGYIDMDGSMTALFNFEADARRRAPPVADRIMQVAAEATTEAASAFDRDQAAACRSLTPEAITRAKQLAQGEGVVIRSDVSR